MTNDPLRTRTHQVGGAHPTKAAGVVAAALAGLGMVGCGLDLDALPRLNAFTELAAIRFSEAEQSVSNKVVPIGFRQRGEVIRLRVVGNGVRDVFILAKDTRVENSSSVSAGRIAGGGPANELFQHRIAEDNDYFVYLLFDASVPRISRRAGVVFLPGEPDFRPPSVQRVVVSFEPDFLIAPTSSDDEAMLFTDDEATLLRSISETVRVGILDRLRDVFAGTPIEVHDEADGLPESPYSKVTFKADRVLAEIGPSGALTDSVAPLAAAGGDDCDAPVVFGELLPRGAPTDTGNQILDDSAAVYVGSFAGESAACRTATFNSVNNLVFGLSRTAAHEIGHLIGLQHVPGFDIMQRSPDLSAQRDLSFGRGLIVIDGEAPEDERDEGVLPGASRLFLFFGLSNVIQDPDLYFRANFDVP